MGLREEKRERTRREILEAAEATFRERGYAESALQDIADQLGLSRQTLYNYFPSKEGILTALYAERMTVIARAVDDLRADFLDDDSRGGSRVERFLHMIRWGLRALAADREFMRVVYMNAYAVRTGGAISEERRRAARDLEAPQAANNQALDRMFESMQKAGELRTDVPPREMTKLYTTIFSTRVAEWLASGDEDPERLEDAVIGGLEIVFRGLRAF